MICSQSELMSAQAQNCFELISPEVFSIFNSIYTFIPRIVWFQLKYFEVCRLPMCRDWREDRLEEIQDHSYYIVIICRM